MNIKLTNNNMNIEYIKGSNLVPELSILICTLSERKNIFLNKLLSNIGTQIENKNVEIVILTDDAQMRIGAKRNLALDSANGKYVCFIDDDDIVSDDYIDSILEKTKEDSDVIVFNGFVTTDGENIKYAKQGMEYQHGEIDGVYYRLPNHLSVHKKETIKERFLDVRTGEDDEWAKRRLSEIKTQSRIDKNLYHYDFRTTTKKYFTEENSTINSTIIKISEISNLFEITINRPEFFDEGNIKLNLPFFENFEKVFKDTTLHFAVYDRFDRVVWVSDNMSVGHFSYWPGITWTRAEIIDSDGNLIWNWKWDPIKDGCVCHQIFHIWSLKNKGSFGIVIGTHDGCTGEWVGAVDEGRLKSLLIEASDIQFENLSRRYKGKSWIKLEKNLITTDGGKLNFYEGGAGYTNSILLEHIIGTGVSDVRTVEKDSESLISLLDRNPGCKWLHIDVEGIDDYLILSLEKRIDLLPELIIYEHESLLGERETKLVHFLKSNGFSIYKGNSRNTIAIK
jgi:glycosyltransferase involved in cell wall biosynthesis